jgi:hypothetical protein
VTTTQSRINALEAQRKELVSVQGQIRQSMAHESVAQKKNLSEAKTALADQRATTGTNTQEAANIAVLRKSTQDHLNARLITQDEASRIFIQLQSFANTKSAASVTENSLQQFVDRADRSIATISGKPSSLEMLPALKTISEIKQQILLIDADLTATRRGLVLAKEQETRAQQTVNAISTTPYALARAGSINLAFVPYDNSDAVVGTSVFDCYLMFVGCRKVGTVKTVFTSEELVDFPVFNMRLNRTVRGNLVQLDLEKPASVFSTVLFVGSKPLFL